MRRSLFFLFFSSFFRIKKQGNENVQFRIENQTHCRARIMVTAMTAPLFLTWPLVENLTYPLCLDVFASS